MIQTNAPEVIAALSREFNRIALDKARLAKEIAIQALADLQTLSPVDTGRYRGAHDLTISEPSTVAPVSVRKEEEAIIEAQSRLGAFRTIPQNGVDIYIGNNLVYAWPIENGHSGQAPQGVYSVAHSRARENIRKAASDDIS